MKLLITGAWKATEDALEAIRRMGHEIVFQQQEADSLSSAYEDIEGVICNGLFLHHSIERFVNLRYIQLTSAGFDRVPMDYVAAHGIEIHNARGVYSIPMAEHAVAGVLALYRRMSEFREFQKEHRWEKIRELEELNGKTVVILGCGSVGTECARRFLAFGCRTIGVDIAVMGGNDAFEAIHPLEKLDSVLPLADILVLTLPLTDSTRHLMNETRLARMNDRTVIVNISRGGVIEQGSLAAELASGRLRAVLDVFEDEPLAEDSPFWGLPNVIITPHISFIGNNNGKRLACVVIGNLKDKK